MKRFELDKDCILEKYDYLWCLSDDRWAWEYARRSKLVRDSFEQIDLNAVVEKISPYTGARLIEFKASSNICDKLGMALFPDPKHNALKADIVWNRSALPNQAEINATFLMEGQVCDLWQAAQEQCDITHVIDRSGQEFVLASNAGRVVQVHCTGVSLLSLEPVRLKLTISDILSFEEKVKAQRSVLEVLGQDLLKNPVWSKKTQILRNGLIALDGLEAGMTRMQIAELIFGKSRTKNEWSGGSLRYSIRYLVKKAQALRDGGFYTELLGSQKGLVWD
ncbi:DNA -binding domain-containing protein [Hirschia litorea]|uniref:DNA -binding domain-containing protein n=1 Tax=Hirschia litorea TaxID=1199156 RepID=A0ABW2IPA3_9PROT